MMSNELTLPQHSDTSFRGGFRLWGAEHGVSWAALRDAERAPGVTTFNGWHVSTDQLCPVLSSPEVVAARGGVVELGVWRGDAASPERHWLDGQFYASEDEARQAAFTGGALAFLVYEDDRDRLGLGGGSDV